MIRAMKKQLEWKIYLEILMYQMGMTSAGLIPPLWSLYINCTETGDMKLIYATECDPWARVEIRPRSRWGRCVYIP